MSFVQLKVPTPESKRADYDYRNRVSAAAEGSWRELLQKIGIPSVLLSGEPSICPACGGSFRFSILSNRGDFACGKVFGDGFALLTHLAGLSFWSALRAAGEAVGQREFPDKGTSRRRVEWVGTDLPARP